MDVTTVLDFEIKKFCELLLRNQSHELDHYPSSVLNLPVLISESAKVGDKTIPEVLREIDDLQVFHLLARDGLECR